VRIWSAICRYRRRGSMLWKGTAGPATDGEPRLQIAPQVVKWYYQFANVH
jgi:hypothetical protein